MAGLFGLLALVLAAVGLYGVTAYAVERRTSEIGVRMALGANRGNVVALVLRGAFTQILIGLLIGIPVSIGCARFIATQLYQVKGWDPLVLGAAVSSRLGSAPCSPASSPRSAPHPSTPSQHCVQNRVTALDNPTRCPCEPMARPAPQRRLDLPVETPAGEAYLPEVATGAGRKPASTSGRER